MLKNYYLVYFVLWILLQLLAGINCQTALKPKRRSGHTATLINNKLYILSGASEGGEKDFFYLDVSVPFNTQNLLWRDLSSVNTVPSHFGAASVNGGANNKYIILIRRTKQHCNGISLYV